MKRILLNTKISKIYIISVILITLLLLTSYFSYAMFTVTKEKSNAISIVTGTLSYDLKVDNVSTESLVVPANSIKEFIITLSNPNSRIARFNFYYIGDLSSEIELGYLEEANFNTPPEEPGINLEKQGTISSSNTYKIKVRNTSDNEITIPLGVGVGLDYNDLNLPSNGHLFVKYNASTLDKILVDNKVQVSKDNMFNYASNGMKFGADTVDPNYITPGVYKAIDEDGVSYYFRGSIDNNNIKFGKYDEDYYVYNYYDSYFQSLESCQEYNSNCTESNKINLTSNYNNIYYKIVTINFYFILILIYNGTNTSINDNDLATSYIIGFAPYNLIYDDPKYTGYTYDNGVDSFIKKEVDTWYNNTLGKNNAYDDKVIEGRFCSDSSGYTAVKDYGINRDYMGFSSYNRIHQLVDGKGEDISPTLICPNTNESYGGSYKLKAGLITVDELIFSGENLEVTSDSYLSVDNFRYYTMTPADFRNNVPTIWDQLDALHIIFIFSTQLNSDGIRPVINLNSDVILSGSGTMDNPYTVQ